MLMDMLATFAENPLKPAVWSAAPARAAKLEPAGYVASLGGIVRDRPRGRRLRLRQRDGLATSFCSARSPLPTGS
jgi:hypothetical protein